MDLGPDREFTFEGLRRQLWWTPVVVVAAALNIGFPLWVILQSPALARASAPSAWLRWDLFASVALWVIALVAGTWGFVDNLLLVRHGSVFVSRVGLVLTDGRGRQRRAFWAELAEVRVNAWFAGVPSPLGALELRTSGERWRIPRGLTQADWAALRDLLIAQAGLTQVTRKWWGVVYTRPVSGDG
jgi:hypothetical protein